MNWLNTVDRVTVRDRCSRELYPANILNLSKIGVAAIRVDRSPLTDRISDQPQDYQAARVGTTEQ